MPLLLPLLPPQKSCRRARSPQVHRSCSNWGFFLHSFQIITIHWPEVRFLYPGSHASKQQADDCRFPGRRGEGGPAHDDQRSGKLSWVPPRHYRAGFDGPNAGSGTAMQLPGHGCCCSMYSSTSACPDAVIAAQAERWGAELLSEDVESVDLSQRPFVIRGSDTTLRAHSVIVATGATAKRYNLDSQCRTASDLSRWPGHRR